MLYCDAITDAMTKGLGQQKACVRYNIITSSMDVAFLYILLPKYGMLGYFSSFLVTHLLNFMLSLRRLRRITGKVITLSMPARTLLSTAFSVWAASHLPNHTMQASAFLVIWGCLLSLLHIIGQEDLLWLKGLVAKK